MAWGKLDDRYDDHRKIKAALRRDPLAAAIHAHAITHCARHESDGLIDPLWIEERAPTPAKRKKALAVLEELVLFDRLPAGKTVSLSDSKGFSVELGPFDSDRHLLHDFLDYNPSTAQTRSKREKDARRKAEERAETGNVHADDYGDHDRRPESVLDLSTRTPDGVLTRAGAPAPPGAGSGRVNGEELRSQGEGQSDAGAQAVDELFAYWQERCKRERMSLTPQRRDKLVARLREGRTVEEVKLAIDGAAAAPHVREDGKRYDDIELICRNATKFEDFRERGERAVAKPAGVDVARQVREAEEEMERRAAEEYVTSTEGEK